MLFASINTVQVGYKVISVIRATVAKQNLSELSDFTLDIREVWLKGTTVTKQNLSVLSNFTSDKREFWL